MFAAVVSKTIVAILSAQIHFLSKLMTKFTTRSPAGSELTPGRAGHQEVLLHLILKSNI